MTKDDYLGVDEIRAQVVAQSQTAREAGNAERAAELDDVLDMIRGSIEYFAWCSPNVTPPPTRAQHRRALHRTLAEYIFQYDVLIPEGLLDAEYDPSYGDPA